jgi:hypothetical protein
MRSIIMLMMLMMAGLSHAASYTKYVGEGGTDDAAAGRGDSAGDPYATIQYAVDALQVLEDGDDTCTIYVSGEVTCGHLVISEGSGMDGSAWIIDGTDPASTTITSFTSGQAFSYFFNNFGMTSGSITLKNCTYIPKTDTYSGSTISNIFQIQGNDGVAYYLDNVVIAPALHATGMQFVIARATAVATTPTRDLTITDCTYTAQAANPSNNLFQLDDFDQVSIDNFTITSNTADTSGGLTNLAGTINKFSVKNSAVTTSGAGFIASVSHDQIGVWEFLDNTVAAAKSAIHGVDDIKYFIAKGNTVTVTGSHGIGVSGDMTTARPLATIQRASNIVTITFATDPFIEVGDEIQVTGCTTDTTLNGIFTVTSEVSATEYTFVSVGDNSGPHAAEGNVYNIYTPIEGAIIEGNTVTCTAANPTKEHALFIGKNARSAKVINNTVIGGLYGLVIKGTGHTVRNNKATGAWPGVCFCLNDTEISHNVFTGTSATLPAFSIFEAHGYPYRESNGNRITHNIFKGGKFAFETGDASVADAIGSYDNIIDYNLYYGGLTNLYSFEDEGTVCDTLAEIQAEWQNQYAKGSKIDLIKINDSHSITENPGSRTTVIKLINGERTVIGLENTSSDGKRTFTAGTGTITLGQ